MTSARATVAAPFSMMAIGLVFILLATLAVVQTQSVTVSPVEADLSSLFETKTGQLTLQAPPYCGRFDIFCFIIFILRTVFAKLAVLFGGIAGGFVPGGALAGANAGSAGSTCAAGRAGRECRQAERQENRAARQQARSSRR